jgi:hypothetical protein
MMLRVMRVRTTGRVQKAHLVAILLDVADGEHLSFNILRQIFTDGSCVCSRVAWLDPNPSS